ncbi:3003_t:CDS:2 [Funneliformis mosseae]|uniref:Mevalonate kinase n=1 Tax=Funneliformis mosseae TaxID=27381 RepID=A0A9N8WCI5_FUNMO|nr:3003_t:CDS:2 [Funneliformis mosseae]
MSSPTHYLISAPGKVILFGEHAVVYGKTAIAGSIDGLRTYILFEKSDDGLLELNLPKLGLHLPLIWPISALPYSKVAAVSKATDNNSSQELAFNEELLKELKPIVLDGNAKNKDIQEINELQQVAASVFLYLYTSLEDKQNSWCGMKVHVTSDLPVGAGLGSSASYSVCLATGLLLALGHIPVPNSNEGNTDTSFSGYSSPMNLINRWAFQAEKVIHGIPSGIDNAVATYGGAVSFTKGEMENVIGFQLLRFLLTNTKISRDTRAQVAKVRVLYDKHPHIVDPILEAIEVGHSSIDRVREITAQHSLHSKLTGAGGGGCVLTLLRDDITSDEITKIKSALASLGFESFETQVGGNGVSVIDSSVTISKQEFLSSENIQQKFSVWKHFT